MKKKKEKNKGLGTTSLITYSGVKNDYVYVYYKWGNFFYKSELKKSVSTFS